MPQKKPTGEKKVHREENSIFSCLDIRDPVEAFDNAIRKGLKNPHEYMYMYSDKGKDYFKHEATRMYKVFKQKGLDDVIREAKESIKKYLPKKEQEHQHSRKRL